MADIYVATTGNDTTGNGTSGNPYATPGKAISVMAAGDTIYVQNGTYTITAELTPPGGTSAAKPSRVIGYNAAIGDLDRVGDFANFPTITTATASLNLFNLLNGNVVISNFVLDCANQTGSRCVRNPGVAGVTISNVKGRRFADYAFIMRDGQMAERCWVTEGGSSGVGGFWTDQSASCFGCLASANACPGFKADGVSGGYLDCVRCIADSNTGASTDGFIATGGATLYLLGCVARNNGRDGLRLSTAADGNAAARDCIFAVNVGYGINAVSSITGSARVFGHNAFWSNTSGATFQVDAGWGDVTLTGDPFTNAAAGDFSLNNIAGAGAACRAAGFPGVFPAGTTTGHLDIGAAQHQDAGGGTAGMLYVPNLEGA